MEMILTIVLIALGIYVIKTSIGAIFKIGICLAIIAMILNILGQVILMKGKVVYIDKYREEKKKDLVYRFKKFIKKVWNIINIG